MIQVLHLSSRWNNLLVSLFISIQFIVSVSGKISPHSFEMFFHKPTTNLFILFLVFPNNYVLTFLEGCLPRSLVAEVVIFFSIPSFLLSSTHLLVSSGSSSFLCLSIRPECCVFMPVLSSYLVLHPFSTGVLSKIVLTPLCHSFNSSRGSVLLLSSSILSSCQDHILCLPFPTGVLS